MAYKYSLSIIIPAYNSEKIINDCLKKIIEEELNNEKNIFNTFFTFCAFNSLLNL